MRALRVLILLCTIFALTSLCFAEASVASVSVSAEGEIAPHVDHYKEDVLTRFQEYLRIDTVQPSPDYHAAAKWLEAQATRIGLAYKAIEFIKDKPVVILTWPGSEPSRKAIMLNSHSDVVPADPEKWTFEPFSATRHEGKVYARGSQDMKCVGLQYLEAIDVLKKQGFQPRSTIHVVYVPDEEIGGQDGMVELLESDYFKNEMNVGFVLDEGLANPTDKFTFFYGERASWWVRIKATGPAGHGSMLLKNPAVEKLERVMHQAMEYRRSQEKLVSEGKDLGEVTTVNINYLKAGHTKDYKSFSMNVIPSEAEMGLDIRITPLTSLESFEELLKGWTAEEGVEYEFVQKTTPHTVTLLENNPYWDAFKAATDELGLGLELKIFPAATDSRHVRKRGLPAFGFSPMNRTPVLLHDHNEYLEEDMYMRGIKIYETLIPALANKVSFE